jgi:hypothetical protein
VIGSKVLICPSGIVSGSVRSLRVACTLGRDDSFLASGLDSRNDPDGEEGPCCLVPASLAARARAGRLLCDAARGTVALPLVTACPFAVPPAPATVHLAGLEEVSEAVRVRGVAEGEVAAVPLRLLREEDEERVGRSLGVPGGEGVDWEDAVRESGRRAVSSGTSRGCLGLPVPANLSCPPLPFRRGSGTLVTLPAESPAWT